MFGGPDQTIPVYEQPLFFTSALHIFILRIMELSIYNKILQN